MVTSQAKNSRRRCIKAISKNTIIVMVVNGFMICSLLFYKAVNIAYLFPFVPCCFKKYITGGDNRKEFCHYATNAESVKVYTV
jgi:hypothetical protein